jgi:hypothetical protein
VAVAAHCKGCVALGAGLVEEFDHPIFEDGFADDGDAFHGMKVHG